MKIGYYVQGAADEAFVWGLKERWCPDSTLEAGRFRGSSGESFRREIRQNLIDLKDIRGCDILVVLTDADGNRWQSVKQRESGRVPDECRHLTLFGVADRNIECWLAADKAALAGELGCDAGEIPSDDPSDFVKRRFKREPGDQAASERIRDYVARVSLNSWIRGSRSFADFYGYVRRLAQRRGCAIPNEMEK